MMNVTIEQTPGNIDDNDGMSAINFSRISLTDCLLLLYTYYTLKE